MSGTKTGGAKAAATNKAKYGKNYYARIGARGGELGTTGGFAANRELAREAGQKGGFTSHRTFTEQERREASQRAKALWAERKSKETMFVADDKPFGEGFGRPSKMRQLMQRMSK